MTPTRREIVLVLLLALVVVWAMYKTRGATMGGGWTPTAQTGECVMRDGSRWMRWKPRADGRCYSADATEHDWIAAVTQDRQAVLNDLAQQARDGGIVGYMNAVENLVAYINDEDVIAAFRRVPAPPLSEIARDGFRVAVLRRQPQPPKPDPNLTYYRNLLRDGVFPVITHEARP